MQLRDLIPRGLPLAGESYLRLQRHAHDGLPAGGPRLTVINTDTRKASTVGITLAKKDNSYAACPGPLDLATFNAHGVALRAGKGGT